jgi:hypothetical protein
VILAEVCRRAGLPLSVVAYHTKAKVLLEFGDSSAGRTAAGCMEAILQAEGGTRIVPALEAADTLIATSPHREHLVICVADGEFNDRERTEFDVITSRWSRSAVRVAGLGLGPQTEGIADWFCGAKGNLQPADLSGEVTRIISAFVSELYGLRAAA